MNAAVKQENSLRSLSDLAQAGLIGRDRVAALQDVAARYAVAITPAVSDLIDPADPADPIARQFVPDAAELIAEPNESADPIGDDAHSPLRGLVHRYPDRVLLKLVSACAVYCRFCFRREMVGPGRGALSADALAAALDYIRAAPQIWEVILTGGDPLILSVRRLARVLDELAAISHVKVMRIHTRVPAVAPERVSPALVRALRAYIKKDKGCFVVLHVNHARELGAKARAACARLIDAGIPMLSQTVLLRGVNDETQNSRRADAGAGRVPHQALLFASRRSRARHRPSTHHHRRGSGADARLARPHLGSVPAVLCARHSRRARQIANRAKLSG